MQSTLLEEKIRLANRATNEDDNFLFVMPEVPGRASIPIYEMDSRSGEWLR
jgi:hypothetical protein